MGNVFELILMCSLFRDVIAETDITNEIAFAIEAWRAVVVNPTIFSISKA